MANIRKRLVSEVIQRYRLEPRLRDIYVEGSTDRGFLDWYCRRAGLDGFRVYEINGIEVEDALLAKYGVPGNGNRDRVIALAAALDEAFSTGGRPAHVVCLADADYLELLGRGFRSESLLLTDCASLGNYLLNDRYLGKYMSVCLRMADADAARLLNDLAPVLQRLFLARATNDLLGWGMQWISPERCCRVTGGQVQFDEIDWTKRYLMRSSRLASMATFLEEMKRLAAKLDPDPRRSIRWHDFSALLLWYLRQIGCAGVEALKSSEAIEQSLLGCAEFGDISGEPLFVELTRRLT